MSDGYTPSIERVRDLFSWAFAWRTEDDIEGGDTDLSGLRERQRAEFDRALAAHDREVAATERERCARIAEAQAIHPDIEPHLTADFREGHRDALIDAAAAIRAGDA